MKNFDFEEYLMGHVINSKEWHLPFMPPVELPGFLTVHSLMLLFCAAFLIIIFCFVYRKNDKVPTGFTNLLEVFILFIRDTILIPAFGKHEAMKMAPFFCTLFFFILGLNFMGLIPLFSTATANINVTGALAMVILTFMIVGSIMKLGVRGFFSCFVPQGVPWPILFIIVPIEFVSMFIKTFALMIRLFANMLAGHLVILAFLGLVILFGAVALPAILLAIFIYLIEILVVFLQAYIFTLLSAMFVGQMLHPEH